MPKLLMLGAWISSPHLRGQLCSHSARYGASKWASVGGEPRPQWGPPPQVLWTVLFCWPAPGGSSRSSPTAATRPMCDFVVVLRIVSLSRAALPAQPPAT